MDEQLTVPAGKTIIGLTGNIATGKSAIMRLAAEHNALTIDADKIVHQLLAEDTALQQAIIQRFGHTIQKDNGAIDRQTLGEIVFGNPQALRQLEKIIHPAVQQRVLSLINDTSASIVMIEAIKLLEGKLRGICQSIWVTHCTREKQLQRLQVCRGWDEETAITRIDSQSPQEDKLRQADIVIDTGALMDDTRRQFEAAWSRLPQPE